VVRCTLLLATFAVLVVAPAARADVTVQAIPALPGIKVEYAGQQLVTDDKGRVLVPAPDDARVRAGLRVRSTMLRHGVHARFNGWRRGRLTMRLLYLVRFSYVGTDRDRINPARIKSLTLRGPGGMRRTISSGGHPFWLEGNRIVPLGRRPVSKPISWAVERATAGGSNVVFRAQQRFTPARTRRLAVRVRFYRLRFAAHDWLLGKAIGSQISLTYPDGHVERHALKDGKVTIGSLPAGLYRVTVEAPGMASDWPVALSRDKDVDVSIISYLDVALGIFVLALLAVGLLLAGRPALRHRLRRVAA